MKLKTQQKNIEIIMDSYEFPYDKDGQTEDNNWMNVKVICEDEIVKEEGISPCLLTWELTALIDSLQEYIDGKITSYTSDFIEPNLVIRLQPMEEDTACYISFLLPHHNDPFVFVKRMVKDELVEVVNNFKMQSKNFSKR